MRVVINTRTQSPVAVPLAQVAPQERPPCGTTPSFLSQLLLREWPGRPHAQLGPQGRLPQGLPFLPLLFTNVQNYKNNAHSVSRCQGALIFQEKTIFRKDLLNDALGELPARQVLNGKKVILHQRERRMASLLLEPGLIVRPVSATILLPSRQALFHHAQKFFCRSLAKPTTTFSLLV